MGRRLRGCSGAVLLAVALGLAGCGFIPMGTGEYLTEDGDGEGAARENAVESLQAAISAASVPGGLLYDSPSKVNDCRNIYTTGNIIASSSTDYVLDSPIPEQEFIDAMADNARRSGWLVVVREFDDSNHGTKKTLDAINGNMSYWIITTLDDQRRVKKVALLSSSPCVKPDGEIVDDEHSRIPDYFKDAS